MPLELIISEHLSYIANNCQFTCLFVTRHVDTDKCSWLNVTFNEQKQVIFIKGLGDECCFDLNILITAKSYSHYN